MKTKRGGFLSSLSGCAALSLWLAFVGEVHSAGTASVTLTKVGEWPGYPRGSARAVVVGSNYAYAAASQAGLLVFDVSNPSQIQRVGALTSGGLTLAVDVVGHYAYLGEATGFRVVDVSSPATPRVVGTNGLYYTEAVQVVSNRAYVIAGGRLAVLDVKDPTQPLILTNFNTGGTACGLRVVERIAYVINRDGGPDGAGELVAIDVSAPGSPRKVSSVSLPGALGLDVSGHYAYVACGQNVLQVVDVTEVSNPKLISGAYANGRYMTKVRIYGQKAYAMDQMNGVQVFDISDPRFMVWTTNVFGPVGNAAMAGQPNDVQMIGNVAYLANGSGGFQTFEVQTNSSRPLGYFSTDGMARVVRVRGQTAFVADNSEGLEILSLTNLAQPQRIGQLTLGTWGAIGLELRDQVLYLASGNIAMVNVSNPARPYVLGTMRYTSPSALDVSGGYLYTANNSLGLKIIDVSNPGNPLEVAGFPAGEDQLNCVRVAGTYAYLVKGYEFQVLDISTPANPKLVGRCGWPSGAYGRTAKIVGSLAYVAGDQKMMILDISEPSHPHLVGSFDCLSVGANALDCDVAGSVAFVAVGQGGLLVLDVSNVANPQFVALQSLGGYALGGLALGVQVAGNKVFIANSQAGLQILRWQATGIQQSQTLDFVLPTVVPITNSPLVLMASASSELPVRFEILSGPGIISDNRLFFTGAGQITVRATQGGNADFLAVTNDQTVKVILGGLQTDCASVVEAWGASVGGEIVVPPGLTNLVTVSGGFGFSIALRSDGTVVAWGDNTNGQTNVPPGLNNAVAISAGGAHALALKADHTVVAWGYNGFGQTSVPAGLSNVVAISAGANHSVALRADGSATSWGSRSLADPPGLSNLVAIAAGGDFNVALRSDSTVIVWPLSWVTAQSRAMYPPTGLSNVLAVAAGHDHALALRVDGKVIAWGSNTWGQLNVPPGLNSVVAVSAGGASFHNLALRADGTVVAWGSGMFGESAVPAGLSKVTAIAAGWRHSLAVSHSCEAPLSPITATPSLLDFGQVQVGSTNVRAFFITNTGPVAVNGTANVTAPFTILSGGEYHLVAGAWTPVVIGYSPTAPGTNRGVAVFSGGTGATNLLSGVGIDVLPPPFLALQTNLTGYPTVGGVLTINCAFYHTNQNLLSLLWHPVLPPAFTLDDNSTVIGDGVPERMGSDILFLGALTSNPVRFSYTVTVNPLAVRPNAAPLPVAGEVTFQLPGMANPSSLRAGPDPLWVPPQSCHSADFRDPRWSIDGAEMSRVLAYWRAGAYHRDSAGADGYAAGRGNTNGFLHSADFQAPRWIIDGTEMNRVLSYWRAGAYHPDPAGLDGFAPGVGGSDRNRSARRATGLAHCVWPTTTEVYVSGTTLQISNTISYGESLLGLLVRPKLPQGWVLESCAGSGNPETLAGDIVWTGSIPPSPLAFTYSVRIPVEARGAQQIGSEIEAQWLSQVNPEVVQGTPMRATPLAIEGVSPLGDGRVAVMTECLANSRVTVEVSSDLAHWEALNYRTNLNGAVILLDSRAGEKVQRFYRARLDK